MPYITAAIVCLIECSIRTNTDLIHYSCKKKKKFLYVKWPIMVIQGQIELFKGYSFQIMYYCHFSICVV